MTIFTRYSVRIWIMQAATRGESRIFMGGGAQMIHITNAMPAVPSGPGIQGPLKGPGRFRVLGALSLNMSLIIYISILIQNSGTKTQSIKIKRGRTCCAPPPPLYRLVTTTTNKDFFFFFFFDQNIPENEYSVT